MKNLLVIAILLLSVFFYSFSFQKEFSIDKLETPPGTIKMSSNLYIDRTEIRNLDYREFMYWTKRVFGINSNEYNSILPDTTVWTKLGKYYENFSDSYLRRPEFRNSSVVGISFSQAELFTKWRSDRVMEFFLIRDGIFKYNPSPTNDSFFTIEKYFNGKYGKVSDAEHLQYYPSYSLPDSITYLNVSSFSDSLNNYALSNYKNKEMINKMISFNYNKNIADKNDTLLYGKYPVRQIPEDFFTNRLFRSTYKYDLILDLKGNVAEITSMEGINFGGSYMDPATKNNFFEKNFLPNCYTGFRNICRYKKWGNKKNIN
jgi:hypothetical protein